MYLRHTTIRKRGKSHTYWRLVRSVRDGKRVRQETVAMLTELDASGRAKARALAEWITGSRTQPSLFEPIDADAGTTVPVRLKEIRLEHSRRFGDVFLGLTLWRALELDEFLARQIPQGREEVAWSTLAAVLTICRLCEPSSELHIAEDLYRKTALEDLLGLHAEKVNDDRLYRALDQLLPCKAALERHLRERLGRLFDLKYDLLLYDVTSTYFEGLAEGNSQAQRGYSRDHRPDCKQVCIALVVTREGMPLSYEVFDGNRVDVTTVEEIVTAIEGRFGAAQRVWVMDRGMASASNLEWLREGGRRYLIGAVKSELEAFAHHLVEKKDWKQVRADVEVKLVESPDGGETFVLCRSQSRREKDRAIVDRFAARLLARLEALQRRLAHSKQPVNRVQVERQIGRLLERHSRAAGKYRVEAVETKECGAGLKLVIEENRAWSDWASLSEGCYLLRSNVADWSEEELWRTYIQITEAESAFRIQKSELSIRPVWHQRKDRVQAHIFVCFLAYVLWKTLEQWQSRAGLGNSPRTLLDELALIQSADVVLPSTDGRELRIRCVVRPNKDQDALLERLGLELPKRLRVPPPLAKSGM